MVIRTIAWMILIPILIFGVFVGYETSNAGSNVQSLTTDSTGKIHAQKRDGGSDEIISADGGPATINDVFTIDKGVVEFQIGEPSLQTSSTARVSVGSFGNGNGTPGSELSIFTRSSGGTITEAIRIANDQKTELSAREDSSCGIGTICSGNHTPVASAVLNLNSTPTWITGMQWMRVGNMVTFSFRVNLWDPDGGGIPSVDFTIPFNHLGANYGSGSCSGTTDSYPFVYAASGTGTLRIEGNDSTDYANGSLWCSGTYRTN